MNSFSIKKTIAVCFDAIGINKISLNYLNRCHCNNYVRIINYHFSPEKYVANFEEQIQWFSSHFENCDLEKLERFIKGEYKFTNKPGMIISFDDGFLENYKNAFPILQSHGFTGYYMVSAGLIGKRQFENDNGCHDYMGEPELNDLLRHGEVIGCHTFSHHRMSQYDNEQVLLHEIVESKEKLESVLGIRIPVFCWCGGEEETYTKPASDLIRKSNYDVSFMTNSSVITPATDRFQLDRSNVEASWPLALVRFQVSGFMDLKLWRKRKRIHKLTK